MAGKTKRQSNTINDTKNHEQRIKRLERGINYPGPDISELQGDVDDLQADVAALETVEAWIPVDGGVGFATGWSNTGGFTQTVAYYKDRERVYLRGNAVKGATGTGLIFTLPSGYWPGGTYIIITQAGPTASPNGVFRLVISNSGTVTTSAITTADICSLDGVSFRAA